MKKALSIVLAAVMVFGTFASLTFAQDTVQVLVTIADSTGELALSMAKISVTDTDNDGKLTICDAIYCAHEEYYDGGAATGFAVAQTTYGISLTKLWGETNGGSFGYYLNNASPLSLDDTVKTGDSVYAFAYTDKAAWSDTYSFFASNEITVLQFGTAELELKYLALDYNTFTYTETPLAGAEIIIDGKKTEYVTDASGKVTIELNDAGTHIISASSDSMTLVPPVCVAEVEKASIVETLKYYFNRIVEAITAFIAQFISKK